MRMRMLGLFACVAAAPLHAQFSPEVRGRVTDARTGNGVADADVRLERGERVRSAANGSFSLRASLPGRQRLIIRRIGYAPQTVELDLANGTVTPLAITLEPKAVELTELAVTADASQAGAIVIERAEIVARGARDVAELLDGVAGVVVTRRGGPGAPATISVRGAAANQLLVLVNGVPRNSGLSGEADLSTIPTGDVARVTLLRGAESARFGPQALAGALLIETRTPDVSQLELESAAGAFGDRGGQARLSMADGSGWAAAAQAELRSNGNAFGYDIPAIRGGGAAERFNADVRRVQGSATLGYEQGRRRWQLRADLSDIDRGMPGSIVQPSRAARQDDRRWSVQVAAAQPIGAWQLDADLSLQQQRTRWRDSAPPFGTAYDDRASLRTWQGRTGIARSISGARVAIGADGRLLGLTATTLGNTAPGTLRHAGFYGSADAVLLDGGPWRLSGALEGRGDLGTLVDGLTISPRARLRLARGLAGLSASWGQGFAPPTPADLFFQDGLQVQPNPNLRPERVRNDLSLAADVRGLRFGDLVADLEATAFSADIDGMILWAPNFRFVWSPFNADVRRRGAEASLRLAHRSGAAALVLQSAHTRVEYVNGVEDGQVIYRPRWTANARLDVRVAALETALAWRYTGARRTAASSSLNQLPAFGLLDLRIQRELQWGRETLRLRAGLENLLDTRAAMLFDYPMPGRTWTAGLALTLPIARHQP